MALNSLNDKQEMFVNEYLKCFNASKAARSAGYSERTAGAIGHELLKKPEIASRIHTRLEEAAMSANEVLYHLAQIARGDIEDVLDDDGNLDIRKAKAQGKTNLIKRVKKKTIITADKDGEGSDIFETETEQYDRMRALELIGKHLAMWTDKMQVNMTIDDKIVAGIKHDGLTYADVLYAVDGDTSLAEQLFARAGVPVVR